MSPFLSFATSVQEAGAAFEPEAARRFLVGFAFVFAATGFVAAPLAAALLAARVPVDRVFFARWGFTHVAAVIVTALVAGLAAGLALQGLGRLEMIEPTGLFPAVFATATILGAAGVVVARYASRLHPEGLAALGWKLDARTWRAVPAAVAGYVLLVPALFGVGVLWAEFAPRLGVEFETQAVLREASELGGWSRLGALLLIAGVAPFLEEWLFRGFLQPLLVQNLRERGGIAVTSLLFAALHGASAFLPVFLLSLYLGWVQLRSHRVLASWAVHGVHNALTLLIVWSLPEAADLLGTDA